MKKYFFRSLFFVFLVNTISAQQTPQVATSERPKLVVGIVIDQMRYDYIYRFWNKFGETGFKKLVQQGFFCTNTNFNYVPTYTAPGHTSIYAGAPPSVHGIIANNWYDRASKKIIYCVDDSTENTVGSNSDEGKMSPRKLLTTSITDELRLSNNMKSKVIAIALKDRASILPGGHLANGAYWYDGKSGNWITSTYYMKELPAWVNDFNAKKLPEKYLNQTWNTLQPIEKYTESIADDNVFEEPFNGETKPVFPHNIPAIAAKNGNLDFIRSLPFGDDLTKDFALQAIESEQLGKGANTDFLAISFSSTDYVGHQFGPSSVELEDTYLRLDKDIADLLSYLDNTLGEKNVLVFLTADHGAVEVPSYLQSLRVPAGYVDTKTIRDSLKKYLKNYFSDSLLLSYSNQQVFLNKKIIFEKNLDLKKIEDATAAFLLRFDQVAEILTASDLQKEDYSDVIRNCMENGYNVQRSGDVMVNYLPAYISYSRTGTTHGSPYSYDTHVPLLWYGWEIKRGYSSSESVHTVDIAPTIAQFLHIQFPDGCTGKPIPFLIN